MQIKIHRGTHQIGGSITEIKTAYAKIIIDIGMNLPSANSEKSADFDLDGVTTGTPDCDAVFVTHYHGDHVGMFEKILQEVPIYMGGTAKRIYLVVQTMLKKRLDKGNPEAVDKFVAFKAGKSITIKDIKITPYSVDHSAFDAYMLLIEAEGKRILYTGDFRMHGARGRKMPAVFEKYTRDIDILIIEGTMLSRHAEVVMTEHELGQKAKELMRDNKAVFVLCSSTNIDSIAEFYSAAIANRKPVIVCKDDFQLEILRIVTETAKSSFYDFGKQKIYSYGSNLHNMMRDRGFCFLGQTNYLTQKAMEMFSNNLLIYSMFAGYIDKNHEAFDSYKREWIDKAISRGSHLEYLHTSGHATAEDLKRVCEITKAKKVIPIHGTHAEAFKDFGISGDILLLQDGEEVNF